MIYPYRCDTCDEYFEIICSVKEYERSPDCCNKKSHDCPGKGVRIFTPHQVCGADDWNNTEFNYGLGKVTRNRKHARQLAKSMGLEEVGTEKTESIHKEFDKKREDRRQERWDNALKD